MNLVGDLVDKPGHESDDEVQIVDFERDRLANIAKRDRLLAALDLKSTGVPTGRGPKPRPKPRKPKTKAIVDEDDFVLEDEDGVEEVPLKSRRTSNRAGASVIAISDSLPPSSSCSSTAATPTSSTTALAIPVPAPTATLSAASANAPSVPEAHGAAKRMDGASGDMSHSPAHGAHASAQAHSSSQDLTLHINAPPLVEGPPTHSAETLTSTAAVTSPVSNSATVSAAAEGSPKPLHQEGSRDPGHRDLVRSWADSAHRRLAGSRSTAAALALPPAGPQVAPAATTRTKASMASVGLSAVARTDQMSPGVTQDVSDPPAVSPALATGSPRASTVSEAALSATTVMQQSNASTGTAQVPAVPPQATSRGSTASPTESEAPAPANSLPSHVREHQAFIKGVSESAEWQTLCAKWLALEIALGDVDSKVRVPLR